MKYETIKVFTDNCITPYKLIVNAGEGTPTVVTESPAKADYLSITRKAGILLGYRKFLCADNIGLQSLIIKDYEEGDTNE